MSDNKKALELPKLSLLQLSLHVADLWLVGEGSIEWVKEPRIRRAWQLLFFSTITGFLLNWIMLLVPASILDRSTTLALLSRSFWVVFCAWLLGLTGYLAYLYYHHLLLTGKDIRFVNIVVFWSTWVLLFGGLYESLYILSPQLFSYKNPLFTPQRTLVSLGFLQRFELTAQFSLYSACIPSR